MASTDTFAMIAAVIQQRWWLQWAIVYAIPMLFYSLGRLVAMRSILDMVATASERTASAKAGGAFLGMLEDFVASTLLAAALVGVELSGIAASRFVFVRLRDHPEIAHVLHYVGHALRFLAAFTLAVVWLTFFASDLLLVSTHEIRLTRAFDRQPSELRDQYRHDVFYRAHVIVGVGGVALLLAGLFAWAMDLAQWLPLVSTDVGTRLPNHTSLDRTRFSSASHASLATPTYLQASFVVLRGPPDDDDDFGLASPVNIEIDALDDYAHVSIVSATGDVDEYHDAAVESLSLAAPILSRKPRSLSRRHRTIALGVAGLAFFFVTAIVALVIANAASPSVASIALNSTLNEIVHGLFGLEFLPKGVAR